ncbi:MAG: flagellar biosynthesis regulator FlaF [Desulfobacterales bacterium]
MYANAVGAYETVSKMTMPGRETEAAVLTKASRKLKACQDHWDTAHRDNMLEEALNFNQRIWSIFQSELSNEDNPLPKNLRLDIIRLSAFIDKRIFETMAEPAPEKLTIIIDINNNLAAGLISSSR